MMAGTVVLSASFDGDGLVLQVGFDALDSFLEADVLLDFLLAVGAVHLRRGGQYDGLDVFGCADACHAKRDE